MNEAVKRPWYREPLVWLLISFPLTAVIAGLITLVIATRTHDGLVADDYYKRGKEINRSLARDEAATRRGLQAQLKLGGARQQVMVDFSMQPGVTLPDRLQLNWLHATRGGVDHTQVLVRERGNRYLVEQPALVPGHWYVQVEGEDWRLRGELKAPAETAVLLKPTVVLGGQ